jgi:predicted metal-dependent peptidase
MTTTATKEKFIDIPNTPGTNQEDNDAREKLISARVCLLLNSPFFGNLCTRLRLINSNSWLKTAATDGKNFYYNSHFINMLGDKEVEFLFGHEVLHVAYEHIYRRDSRHPQLWNIACDYAVNQDLVKCKIGTLITTVPALYDKKYTNWSAEKIYDDLYENAEKIDISDLISKLIDNHLDGENNSSNGNPVELSEEEKQQIRDEFREAMIAAAQQTSGSDIPSGIKQIIEELTEPKINWRELLRSQILSTIRSDFTWMRPSKKGWHVDAIMPGSNCLETIDIAVALDTSGSISAQMIRDFLSEVKGIMDNFEDFKLHLFCFDTSIYNSVTYQSDNLTDINEYEVMGRGGTDFECVFTYLKDNDIEPQKLVFLTDGYPCGSWGDPNYCDTIFIIHGSDTIVAPFGVTSYYEVE